MTTRPDRAWRRPLAIAIAFLAALSPATPSLAQAPRCEEGRSLVPRLEADGRMRGIEAAAASVPNGEGRLWRIERPGVAPSFLFGTMHLSDPRVLALPKEVKQAFASTGEVVIETLDVLDEAAADLEILSHPELMVLPGGRALGDELPAADRRELERLLAGRGMPYPSVRTLQPWFAAMALMLPACEAVRAAAGERPLDVRLALDARSAGRPVAGLESSLEQLRTMASMPMSLQTANLLAALKKGDEIPDLFETMIGFYLEGRIAAITPLSDMLLPADGMPAALADAAAGFERRIVADRNHRMAARLTAHLEKGGAFVAVGALHLPGMEGLVELLKAQGYAMTRAD